MCVSEAPKLSNVPDINHEPEPQAGESGCLPRMWRQTGGGGDSFSTDQRVLNFLNTILEAHFSFKVITKYWPLLHIVQSTPVACLTPRSLCLHLSNPYTAPPPHWGPLACSLCLWILLLFCYIHKFVGFFRWEGGHTGHQTCFRNASGLALHPHHNRFNSGPQWVTPRLKEWGCLIQTHSLITPAGMGWAGRDPPPCVRRPLIGH